MGIVRILLACANYRKLPVGVGAGKCLDGTAGALWGRMRRRRGKGFSQSGTTGQTDKQKKAAPKCRFRDPLNPHPVHTSRK
jgi:hypothetical protein